MESTLPLNKFQCDHFGPDGNFTKPGEESAIFWAQTKFAAVVQWPLLDEFDLLSFATREHAEWFMSKHEDLRIHFKSWED